MEKEEDEEGFTRGRWAILEVKAVDVCGSSNDSDTITAIVIILCLQVGIVIVMDSLRSLVNAVECIGGDLDAMMMMHDA